MITKNIYLDAWSPAETNLTVTQGEADARFLNVHLMNNGLPVDLTGCEAVVYCTKPDETMVFQRCSIADPVKGQITVPLTQQMSLVPGAMRDMELRVNGIADGSILKIRGLKIVVRPAGNYDEAIESTNEFSVLQEAVDAAGCYLPEVTQLSPDTVEISFVPSKETMAPVESRTITLNAGPKGDPGDPGPAPVRGVDYWTPDDVTAMESDISEKVTAAVAGKAQLKPEFANSIGECTDTSKLYVLPDGMIYAWMLTEREVEVGGADYTNILPLAVNADGTPYVGNNGEKGYKTGWRLNSSKAEVEKAGMCCTGFMPISGNGTLRVKTDTKIVDNTIAGSYLYAFASDRAAGLGTHSAFGEAISAGYINNVNGVWTFDLSKMSVHNNSKYIRLSIPQFNADTVITYNQEITESRIETVTEYAWTNTGHAFVPADYEDRIIAVEETAADYTARITALEKAVESGGAEASEKDAYTRMKNWKYPIHEDAPVFMLETDKPAVPSTDWNTEAIYARYDALMSANAHYITKIDCGMASDGTTPIYAYRFKEPEPHYNGTWSETKATILVCSGVHPTEQSGVWSMYYAMEEITNNPKLRDLRRNVDFVVMPMIHPTAFTDSTYGVRNPDGIQVHYNFEVDFKYPTDSGYVAHGERNHGGETPLSIPETQYFDALMEEYKDTLACVLSCHNNDVDTQWGTGFVWSSCATHFMCNLGFRLADKLSAAWRDKHGSAFDEGVRWANNYALTKKAEGSSLFPNAKEQPEWDYRVGRASMSGSGGTEYKQALKYGVHGINVEVCDRCMILDKDFNAKRTANVMTMGAETYINFFRMFMAVYDPKAKKEYAPNLPWSE